jgi:hypothetical protein
LPSTCRGAVALPVTMFPVEVGAAPLRCPLRGGRTPARRCLSIRCPKAVFAIPRSQFLHCDGCTAWRRYFTVAAAAAAGPIPAPGALRANPSAGGADRKRHGSEIGSLFMPGAANVMSPLPQRRATAQRRGPLIALIVVGVSLGTGYGASRVWPLPMSSVPPLNAQTTALLEPAAAQSTQPRLPASSPSPAPSQQLIATPDLSPAATVAARTGAGSQTPSYSAPVEPVALEAPSKHNDRKIEDEASPPGPTMVRSPHPFRARHARSTPAAGPTAPEFAPNPRPNQPARDFMAYRSRH